MKSKWRVVGLDEYVVGEDNNIYRIPFESNGKWYDFRLIKEQYPQRFRLNKSWWTKNQLRHKLVKDNNPVAIFNEICDILF